MKIINNYYFNTKADSQYYNNSVKPSAKNVKFTAHFDYYILAAKGYDVTASNYFRRGNRYGFPSENFKHVINCLSETFEFAPSRTKKMLIGGVGKSQEPFSILASVKDIIGETPIAQKLDLYTVDIQSKPTMEKLYEYSFLDDVIPAFAKGSFIKDDKNGFYRVKDEIFNYLAKTYNDINKSLWDTRIQEAVKNYPSEIFDVVSVNNTLFYIDDFQECISAVENIMRSLKKGGFFITDPVNNFGCHILSGGAREVHRGIYKKI